MDTDFKYLTENILTDDHHLSSCTCKHCNSFKIFDGLKFDCLAGKRQNPPCQNFVLYGMIFMLYVLLVCINIMLLKLTRRLQDTYQTTQAQQTGTEQVNTLQVNTADYRKTKQAVQTPQATLKAIVIIIIRLASQTKYAQKTRQGKEAIARQP